MSLSLEFLERSASWSSGDPVEDGERPGAQEKNQGMNKPTFVALDFETADHGRDSACVGSMRRSAESRSSGTG